MVSKEKSCISLSSTTAEVCLCVYLMLTFVVWAEDTIVDQVFKDDYLMETNLEDVKNFLFTKFCDSE